MIIYEEVFRAFQEQKVKYILVGGIAVNLLGAMRNTADLDILVEMSDANLKKIIEILKNLDYHVKQPIDPMKILDKKTREDLIEKKHMKALNFYKKRELKEIDIIIESPIPYEDAKRDVIYIKVDNLKLPVISIDNLIKMKRETGRAVDKLDIVELSKIQKLKKGIMTFKWETEDERLLRFMKIPPKMKLEWLQEMHEFMVKCSSKRTMRIRKKLRETR